MSDPLQNNAVTATVHKRLPIWDLSKPHKFSIPAKEINEGDDVLHFLTSRAYSDIGTFVMQLNIAMCPRKEKENGKADIKTFELNSNDIIVSGMVERVQSLLRRIEAIIEEAPPDTGPRRFGNVSFRKWHQILEERVPDLMRTYIPSEILDTGHSGEATAQDELTSYLLGAFGSPQRLDYGTGHELSFLAFLGSIWKLGGFTAGLEANDDGKLERSIVIGIFEPYLNVIRRLILTYTLEPAGSHGVWGLDDHFFLSYIFGSAQYCPAITDDEAIPTEGSLPNTPNPSDVTKKNVVDRERKNNMYFSAIGFINDVKTGPFWEHSPILFDISGIRNGWGKVNKGMIKMYNAEVLSKFPVVQHFRFGSLFSWETDPEAVPAPATVHTSSHPAGPFPSISGNTGGIPTTRQVPQGDARAPWGQSSSQASISTAVPWAMPSTTTPTQAGGMPPTHASWASASVSGNALPGGERTSAPWATSSGPNASSRDVLTRAPWANLAKPPNDAAVPKR